MSMFDNRSPIRCVIYSRYHLNYIMPLLVCPDVTPSNMANVHS